MMNNKLEIKNWKLIEVIDLIEVVGNDSPKYIEEFLEKNNLPAYPESGHFSRNETYIDWNLMPVYFSFFFDFEGWDNKVMQYLLSSELSKSSNVVITYGWEEPVVKLPVGLFIREWEEFIRSAKYQTLIVSEENDLIIEVSRDYYMHSNFRIFSPLP